MPDVVDLLADLGGVARRSALLAVVDRRALDAAVSAGTVTRVGRGHYALPTVDEATSAAAQLGGVVSHRSAALRHGWGVRTVPDKPDVTVSRGRKLKGRGTGVAVHRGELTPDEVADGVTTPARTLLDCLRSLPFTEGLAIADSALRESGCRLLLERVAENARGPGSRRVRMVAEHATGLAANPFESSLRAICLDVPGLSVRPQVTVSDDGFRARVDLADERLRIVCEADSFEWHGSRSALASDARRYNRLLVAGWIVLRFAYEDVMFHPEEVRDVLLRAVALAEVLSQRTPRRHDAA
ncbi:DUF559 domain-containing protein [Nocardioides sp. SYSU DS0663]|uniref:DUF559 domain-containing protein n=1 Tax=Nocardioides sp. SYSU DS0663 TaxID=3416445 RepID=UPI003F4BF44A